MDLPFLKNMSWKDTEQQCNCDDLQDGEFKSTYFETAVQQAELKKTRKILMDNYKKQNWQLYATKPILKCNPKSPIHYQTSGNTIEPRSELSISDVFVDVSVQGTVDINISATYGMVTIKFDGKRKNMSDFKSISVPIANEILKSLKYSAIFYDARPYTDYITIDLTINQELNSIYLQRSKAHIPVEVEKKPVPGEWHVFPYTFTTFDFNSTP